MSETPRANLNERSEGLLPTTNVTNEIVRVLKTLLPEYSGGQSSPGATFRGPWIVSIGDPIDDANGMYNGKMFPPEVLGGTDDGLTTDAIGTTPTDNNCIVWDLDEIADADLQTGVLIAENTDGLPVLVVKRSVGSTFVVNLEQTGGANGDQTTAPTWTYTVTNLLGRELGTVVSPQRPRTAGLFTAATKGYGYYDEDHAFQLAEAWETPDTWACEEDEE